jgi:nucleoid DNA-binding protein
MATATLQAKKPASKSETFATIAAKTGLTRKQVSSVFDALTECVAKGVAKKGPGVFVIPGLAKITVQHKPATPERAGTNPFTGEPTIFKAKPARNVVKVRPLKRLKEMV